MGLRILNIWTCPGYTPYFCHMLIHSLKICLLVAVLLSQLMGGISCCCSTRWLSSIVCWRSASLNDTTAASSVSGFVPKCPKCRKLSEPKPVAESNGSDASLTQNKGQCNCGRHDAILSFKKSFEPSDLQESWNSVLALERIAYSADSHVARSVHSPPKHLSPSGHSWQSLVCLWRI
jgi:hypothetical protein